MKFCKYCMFWDSPFPDEVGNQFGQCTSDDVRGEIVVEKRPDIVDEIYEPEKGVFTVARFGCIHWRERDLKRVTVDWREIL